MADYTYVETAWVTGDPITQEKMNKIEHGISNAYSQLSSTSLTVNNLQNQITTINTDLVGVKNDVDDARSKANQAYQATDAGTKAWAQVSNAIRMENNSVTLSLNDRIGDIENKVSNHTTELEGARKGKTNLRAKIDDLDINISSLSGSVNTIEDKFANAKGLYNTVEDRFSANEQDIDTLQSQVLGITNEIEAAHNADGTTLNTRFTNLENEINAAHESTALNKTGANAYGSIDARFEAIESELAGSTEMNTRLDSIESDISSLSSGKVSKTDIANNLTTETAGKVLDATQGKALKDALDSMDTAYKAADTALDGRLDAIDGGSALDTTNGTLSARVGALETEMTNGRNGLTDLDARFDAVETTANAAAVASTVNTALNALDARLDAIDGGSALDTTDGTAAARIGALETALGDNSSGVTGRVKTLEDTVNHSTTGLAATKSIADTATTNITNLTTRVTTLEGKDTVVIPYDGEHSNYTNDEPNYATPTENADYLIADDNDKYFYWRYIDSNWEMISGAGGGGTGSSSGVILAELPTVSEGDPNIDYFIGTNALGYTHYRFITGQQGGEGQYVKILPNNLISSIGVNSVEIKTNESATNEWPAAGTTYVSGGLNAYALGDSNQATNLLGDFVAVRNARINATYEADGETLKTQTLQVLDTNGNVMEYPIVGGSGGGSVYTVRIETTTATSRTYPANSTEPVTITAKVVMKQGNDLVPGATATGQLQYRVYGASAWNNGDRIEVTAVDDALKYIIQNDTYFTIDVTKYLEVDKTIQFRLAITAHPESEEIDVMRYQTYNVSKVNISIADEDFDYASVKSSNFQFNYRCFGSGIAKTVHFLLDGTDAVTPVSTTSHNAVLQQVIPMTGKENGMHTFQVYFVTNTGLRSNTLNYYILYNTDSSRVAPLLGAAAENTTITDGDELIINYSVATIGSETTEEVVIKMYDDLNSQPIQTSELTDVSTSLQTWRTFSYPKVQDENPITVYVVLTATHDSETTTQTIEVTVNQLITSYTLEPEGTGNLVYLYEAYGRSNNDANKNTYTYTYTNVTGQDITFTGTLSNFNWSTDGYVDGKSLTIGGGATYSIDVPIFSNNKNNISFEENAGDQNVLSQDITQKGRTIEIDYEVQSATNLNATIIDCMSNNHRGFRVTPQACYLLNSSTDVEIDNSGFILNEDQIAAAYLTPGQRMHLVFVIEPWATDAARDAAFDGEYHQSVNIYVNGEFANTCPYNRDKTTGIPTGNDFSTNATITIGSDTCLIKLYSIKLYNRGLTQEQVLQNYKVAPVATRDKLTRLEENDILNAAGFVDYEKAKKKYTCLLLTGPAPTTQTGDVVPTVSPFKGAPSPAGRRDKKTNEIVGKTESGLTLTKPSKTEAAGYTVEFNLQDTIPAGAPAYMGAVGSYCSSNNVQGTSSQKYPVHNLKVYLAKYSAEKTTTKNVLVEQGEEIPEGVETVEIDGQTYKVVTETTPAEIKKVKYCLKGKDNEGNDLGTSESTLCWKADYMSTDHANTFNANIADGLFNNRAEDGWPLTDWAAKKYQNTVYGIRCLLFQKQGDNPPEFLGDGCLNNDKGNSKTYGLEYENKSNPELSDDGNDTRSQKWEFTNNSEDLGYFKTDDLFAPLNGKIRAKNGFESTYPDEGDLKDDGLEPNYNHLQVLLTWVSKRANYWDETDPDAKAAKKLIFKNEFSQHFILSHVLTYYIFLQYTALCDNRVKNMFLRSDNVREEVIRNINNQVMINGNEFPQDDTEGTRWAEYVNTTTGVTDPTVINWSTSTFAKWVPVLYDLDSCFGVENVGLIKIRYDADWDYEWKETPQFNGYNSVFWLMVEDTFQNEIATLALSLYNQYPGLNFRTFNQQQIIENQQQISPALTNQDMIIKFDKPWSEGFINYAETPDGNGNYPKQTPQYKYLQRGSRAAQKSQFMQQRSMLLSSYYGADEFLNSSIKFRTGVPVGASGNVIGQDDQGNSIYGNGDLTETQITVKANQILYPGVAYGDNKPATRYLQNDGKVAADTACTIQATSAVQGNDGIFIYGASVLTDIGDISKFKPLQLDVSAGVNLKRLIIGSNANGYSNNTTNSITGLNKCILLEEINVRNLKQMATLTLTSNGFIKNVYAAGSGIGTISLPQGGVLETIEYGSNTTDITILNQSRLTNFSYEDSNTNHYANVTRLWIENTPNVPVKDIITARLTALSSADQGLRSGGLRIIGINLNLGDDPTFLQLITSNLAQGTKLTASGSHIAGTTEWPTITGTITISSIRASLLNKLAEIYPDLIINYNERKEEFEVRYENYDGTLLFSDYGINTDSVKDPVYDNDPVTNAPYISMPTKPSDAQYNYRFGTYDNQDRYRRFSGWVRKGTTINPTSDSKITGTLTYVAYYPTTEVRQYTVRWFGEQGGQPLLSYTEDYGTPIGTFAQPEDTNDFIRAKFDGSSVKVFKGWDRSVGKLIGNIDVYAQWETSNINDDTQNIVMSNLTAADVYAIATQVSSGRKDVLLRDGDSSSDGGHLGDPIMIQMGHDFNYIEGVETTNLLGADDKIVFEGNTDEARIFNSVKPLASNQDWTLALDYKFLMSNASTFNNGNEFVLASCYQNANSSIQGFKLSLVSNANTTASQQAIQVSWGSQTVTIDYAITDSTYTNTDGKMYFKSYRNMVVLVHNADSPNDLTVYYTPPLLTNTNASYGADYGNEVTSVVLHSENVLNINVPLILGGNYSGTTTTIESNQNYRRPAQAVVYWGKYWTADLGEKNCMNLAAWPHETVPFYLSGYNGTNAPVEQIYADSALSFVAAQGMGDRYVYTTRAGTMDDEGVAGWHASRSRGICNNIIYRGMPTAYQSIIRLSTISSGSLFVTGTTATMGSKSSDDYLFLPSEKEITSSGQNLVAVNGEVNTNWVSPWHWMIPATIKNVYSSSVGTSSTLVKKNVTEMRYFYYRFSGHYIKPTAKIFTLDFDPTTRTLSYDSAIVRIQSGDVWIDSSNTAYMYFTNEEIAEGEHIDIVTTNGGWKRADVWNLRTLGNLNGINGGSENYFEQVQYNGDLVLTPSTTTNNTQGRLLCPEFTI